MADTFHRAADRTLTVVAALGVVALLGAVLGAVLGVRPLVFRSGSMAPAIDTGALALAREVPAADLRVGDVVSVTTASGSRVTHRVVAAEPVGTRVRLTLRGDANRVNDVEQYPVGSAYQVFWHVPMLGYAAAATFSPMGLLVLGLVLFVLLAGARRGRHDANPPRHRTARRRSARTRVAAVAVATATASAGPAGSAAAAPWTDPVVVTADVAGHTVQPPDSLTCSANLVSATISWTEKDPRYDYELVLRRWDDSVASTRLATGAAVSHTYSTTADFGFGILALGTFDFTAEVRSYLALSAWWRGADVVVAAQDIRVTVISLLGIPVLGTISCV